MGKCVKFFQTQFLGGCAGNALQAPDLSGKKTGRVFEGMPRFEGIFGMMNDECGVMKVGS